MVKGHKFEYEEVKGFRFETSLLGQSKAYSHIYYIDGLLVDTGHSLKKKVIQNTLKTFNVDQIFITHHHEDHTGNIKELQALWQCPVFGSQNCANLMKKPPRLSLAQKLYWGNRPGYDNILAIKDEIKTKKYKFQLLPIPGHAKDMVALFEPERKWLFSADLYINDRIGYFMRGEDIWTQISSIKKVLTLDFKVLFCSHNPQLSNAKQKLRQKLDFLEQFTEDVMSYHKKGYTEKEIFKALKLKELKVIKNLSFGHLSKMNMVKSVLGK
ncbi:MBL fold metallo-hydrolase [Crocinitomix algicola]|uniref:MBL fold metallo-hydrolase n=1 Tax=Crocinitomix algicola TaxID=1740263 RepID=UPI000872B1F0|nr:MBL fold metallo-hydrolase [Crocinitomix algicola]